MSLGHLVSQLSKRHEPQRYVSLPQRRADELKPLMLRARLSRKQAKLSVIDVVLVVLTAASEALTIVELRYCCCMRHEIVAATLERLVKKGLVEQTLVARKKDTDRNTHWQRKAWEAVAKQQQLF